MGKFTIPSSQDSSAIESSSSSAPSDVEDDLPYPLPLSRGSFLTADFSPTAYLSSLHNRHQTLEDLRQELRGRSRELDAELLELVNNNYSVFLGLGKTLKGGDDKVEEVRLGLLGFQREIDTLKSRIGKVLTELDERIQEKEHIQEAKRVGACLVEYHGRLEELEARLMLDNQDDDLFDLGDDEDDDTEEDGIGLASPARLARLAADFRHLKRMTEYDLPSGHPFVKAQDFRRIRIRNTLLLDLGTAVKTTLAIGEPGRERLVQLMGVYADMDEAKEGVKVLSDSRRTAK